MTKVHLWARDEVKEGEKRTGLTPEVCKALLQSGNFTISIEKSSTRCFSDEEYSSVGCTLVPTGTWQTAPSDAYIFGLKELPDSDEPLTHTHVFFGHCFKEQKGWKELLNRFKKGGGCLLDMEFLVDEHGRRVAAFGRPAGVGGAAVGLALWCHRQIHGDSVAHPPFVPYKSEEDMLQQLSVLLKQAKEKAGRDPTFMVIGAKGRCGGGVLHVLHKLGLKATEWDMAETAQGGPFKEVLEHDVFLNTIYLTSKISPFITLESINQKADRRLRVVVDVSCDVSNPFNPIPICSVNTTLNHPTLTVPTSSGPLLEVISIDHLPTLVPVESSVSFSSQLLPSLLELPSYGPVWQRARTLFNQKAALVE
eukprot:TRINITY_DN1690_c0_g1_i1.p1 TRINITY_DN1690_c0_g1~~TRINITY_DN1690_c0_g1_i1.p1  ORF type:complete len:365 (+),score=97.36 TRINITY_DN1690_c0_g1_i1:84-1178(+)